MDDLTGLVARTEGAQPWRKVFHALNGLVIVGAMALLEPSNRWTVLILGTVTVALLALDVTRLLSPKANAAFFKLFNRLASPRELSGLASSTWYAIGVFLTASLFDRAVAVTGILVLGLADPLAGYIGRRWGRRPWMGGTLEGSLVFFTTAALVVGIRHGWWRALPVAVIATLAERRSWPLDDNLTIPLVCAGSIALVAAIA